MEYQIVVARYNEDISYLSIFKNIIIIYNKGIDNLPFNFTSIKLPNIGRESHTYLYHIIKNYDNLANKTLFMQGKVSDHKILPIMDYFKDDDFIGNRSVHNIDLIKNNIKHTGKYLKELNSGYLKKSKYTPYEWINNIGIDISDDDKFEMVWGANFSVSKELILKRPKIFYENLIKYVDYDINPEEGHYFERAWYLIFNHTKIKNFKTVTSYLVNDQNNKNTSIKMTGSNEINIWKNVWTSDLKIKYINYFKYVEIYPVIYNDNYFDITLESLNHINGGTIFILLEFYNNITYEIVLSNNSKCSIYNNINDRILNARNIYLNKINLRIMWSETGVKVLNIDDINNIIPILNYYNIDVNPDIISIKIKTLSYSEFLIDYEHNINNLIYPLKLLPLDRRVEESYLMITMNNFITSTILQNRF